MTLYIIRHGETDFNRQGIVQGSGVDAELNHIGKKQAQLFYQYYKNVQFDYIITSALKRTHQTVEPFLQLHRSSTGKEEHKNWVKLPELNEISWGIHEAKPSSPEQHENYKKLMSDWETGVYDSKIEGGESALDLQARVERAVEYFKQEQHSKKNILVCTHGRTLLCLLTVLNGHPLSKMSQFKHQNTCLYKVHLIDGEFVFETENDVRHLGNHKTVNF